MRMEENRSFALYVVLSLVTCGIYPLYYVHRLSEDTNIICAGDGRTTPGIVPYILLSIVTCGIYQFIWWYNLGNRLAENAPRYGLTFREDGTTLLMWQIFGMLLCAIGPFIAIYIVNRNINELSYSYNQANGYSGGFGYQQAGGPSAAGYCPQCGAVTPTGATICPNCGKKL